MKLDKGRVYPKLPQEYLRLVLNYEGGYSNRKEDLGGETNRGITFRTLERAKRLGVVDKSVTVRSLSSDLESVRKIYEYMFYLVSKSHLMPHPLAFAHFDASVNHGPGNSGKFLQRTLNKLNCRVDVDGVVGPKTLAALSKCLQNHDVLEVTSIYCFIRLTFYNAIVANRPDQMVNYNGWMNRLNKVKIYCGVVN